LADLTGLEAPRLRLPHALPLAYAAAGELVLARFGFRPDVALDGVRMARQRMFYATEKAATELGAPRSPVTTALADAVSWFRGHGFVSVGRDRAEEGWRYLSSKP